MMEEPNRYRKQILLREIGAEGQDRLGKSRAVVIGCGALGTVIANSLVRMGTGSIVIVDRDYIETDNLHRQILFDGDDVSENLPKAVAAARKLSRINPTITIEPVVADINAGNIEDIVRGADCVIDGTDNFETRFLINDACHRLGIPWVYGGVVSTYGMSFTIIPGETACFRCFMRDAPKPGTSETCDTVGVLATAVSIVASIETTEAVKILSGRRADLQGKLVNVDVWNGVWESFELKKDRSCPLCGHGKYDYLDARVSSKTVSLCGRNAMQITPGRKSVMDFKDMAQRLERAGSVHYNEHILKFSADGIEISLFRDGRAILKGVTDEAAAKTAFSKYIGI